MPAMKAVLEESNDDKGTCVRSVSLAPDGSLRIEGHESQGIESEFWNRIGD